MTRLDDLPMTSAGQVPKRHALRWLSEVDDTQPDQLTEVIVPKPKGFTGNKLPTPISDLRITGDSTYLEAIAGLIKPVRTLENDETRLDLKLEKIKDRETGKMTENYVLYLSVAERSPV